MTDQAEANQKAKTDAITKKKTWSEQLLKVEQNASKKYKIRLTRSIDVVASGLKPSK